LLSLLCPGIRRLVVWWKGTNITVAHAVAIVYCPDTAEGAYQRDRMQNSNI